MNRSSRGDWRKTSHTSSPIASRNSVDRLSAYAKAPSRPLYGAKTAPQKDFDDYIDFIAPPRPSVTRSSFSDDIDLPMSMDLPSIDFADSMELSSAMSVENLSYAGVSSFIASSFLLAIVHIRLPQLIRHLHIKCFIHFPVWDYIMTQTLIMFLMELEGCRI